jgi:membrane protease YdiL (CAAX protease family)
VPFTLSIFAVILTYIWLLEPRLPGESAVIPIGLVIVLGIWHAVRSGEWGLSGTALAPALGLTAVFTVAAVAALVAAGAWLGTLHNREATVVDFGALVVWGAAQQWILQTVVLRETQRATSRTAGILVGAVLFASLHLPNPFLASMTLIGALGWCAIYSRFPNVIPLALSHALATQAILYAFDDGITGRLRIGYSYLMLNQAR